MITEMVVNSKWTDGVEKALGVKFKPPGLNNRKLAQGFIATIVNTLIDQGILLPEDIYHITAE